MDVRVESDGRIVVEDEEYLYGYDIGKTTFERYYNWILWRDEREGDQAFLFENAQGLEKVWEGIQKCLRCQAAATDPGGSPSKIEHRLKFQPVLDDIAGGSDGAREKARNEGIKESKQEKARKSKRKQEKASKRKQEKARESKRKQEKARESKRKQQKATESNRKQQKATGTPCTREMASQWSLQW